MSRPDADEWPNIFPAMRYRDAPASLDWLEKAFGFRRQFVVPGQDRAIAHAQMSFGRGMIMLGSPTDDGTADRWDVRSPVDVGGATAQGVYICICVDDIDAHYARAKGAGAEITRAPQDTDYGSREYTARDPEGHLWSFGT